MIGGALSHRLLPMVLSLAALAHGAGTLGAQARVEGRVTDAPTGRPLAHAQVTVEGTHVVALANSDGRYVLGNVPPGTRVIVAQLIGYAPTRVTVSLSDGAVHVADLSLHPSAIALEEVVVVRGPWSRLRPLFPVSALIGGLLLMSLAGRRTGHRGLQFLAAAAGGTGAGVLFTLLWLVFGGGSLVNPGVALQLPLQGAAIGACLGLWSDRAPPTATADAVIARTVGWS
jgi:hypothetical protein